MNALYLRALGQAHSQAELAARWLNDEVMATLVASTNEGEVEIGVRAFELLGSPGQITLLGGAEVAPVATTAQIQ